MQQQQDLIVLNARHNLMQHGADDALTCAGCRRGMMPGSLQISTHLQQTLALLGIQSRWPLSGQLFQLLF